MADANPFKAGDRVRYSWLALSRGINGGRQRYGTVDREPKTPHAATVRFDGLKFGSLQSVLFLEPVLEGRTCVVDLSKAPVLAKLLLETGERVNSK
jgi:hypothetical protein